MIKVRCSSLDGLDECPPSVLNPHGLIFSKLSYPQAALGKAVHAMLQSLVVSGTFDLRGTLIQHGIDPYNEEAAELAAYGVKAWAELAQFFPQPQAEVEVSASSPDKQLAIDGTVDLLSPVSAKEAIFLDWKTGYLDEGYHNQMWGYAYCIWSEMGQPDDANVVGVVCFLRNKYYRICHYKPHELREWMAQLLRNTIANRANYRVGATCRHCGYADLCPAKAAKVSGFVDLLIRGSAPPADPVFAKYLRKCKVAIASATSPNDPDLISAVADLTHLAKLAEQQIDGVREEIRAVVARVGPIPQGADAALALRKVVIEKVDAVKGWRTMAGKLTLPSILKCVKVSLPALMAEVSTTTIKALRRQTQDELKAELVAAGALTATEHLRLELISMSPDKEPDERIVKAAIDSGADQGGGEPTGSGGKAGQDTGDGQAAPSTAGPVGDGPDSDGGTQDDEYPEGVAG